MFVDVSFSYRESRFAHRTPYILHSTAGERPLSELQPVWKPAGVIYFATSNGFVS